MTGQPEYVRTSSTPGGLASGGEIEVVLRAIFPGDSEMAGRMRAFDWAASDFGPVEHWPETLRAAVRLCLTVRIRSCSGGGPGWLCSTTTPICPGCVECPLIVYTDLDRSFCKALICPLDSPLTANPSLPAVGSDAGHPVLRPVSAVANVAKTDSVG
jgi:hypothetical protein